jgi:hypothetical protein
MPIDNDKIIEVIQSSLARYAQTLPENSEAFGLLYSHRVGAATAVLTALSSSGYIICQAGDAETGEGSAATPSQLGGSGDAVLDAEIVRVHTVLLERLKLKYAGDCKCGNCFLVPGDIIMNAANLISYSLPRPTVLRQLEEAQADTATEDAG